MYPCIKRCFRKILIISAIGFLSGAACFAQEHNLDYFINQGLANSPLLKDYSNQIHSNSIDSMRLAAGLKPQVNLNGLLMEAPVIGGVGYDATLTNQSQYLGEAQVTKDLLGFKTIKPQYADIALQNKGIANTSKISERDLKKSITAQYITAYSDYTQLQFNQKLDSLLHGEEKILKQLTELGTYKQSDYLSFLITIQAQDITISQQKLQYKDDLVALNILAGIADTNEYALTAPGIEKKAMRDLASTPFLLQYKIDSTRNANQKAIVDARYRPHLGFVGDAGFDAIHPETIYKNVGISVGLNFTMPIYDGRLKKLDYQKIEIAQETESNYKATFIKQYNQQISQINSELVTVNSLINLIKQEQRSSEILISIDKDLLERGNISITDYIVTIKSYISTGNDLKQAQVRKLLLTNQLNYWNW